MISQLPQAGALTQITASLSDGLSETEHVARIARAWEHARNITKACAYCGEAFTRSNGGGVAEQTLYNSEELMEGWTDETILYVLLVRGLLCPACIIRGKQVTAEMETIRRIDANLVHMKRHELFSEESQAQVFAVLDAAQAAHSAVAWATARQWTPSMSNLWIFGLEGRGKTFMAHCILNAMIARGHIVAEIFAIETNRDAKRFDFGERIKHFAVADVLLIDDIDKATWTDDGITAVWDILDARNRRKLRTLITANIDPVAFRDDVLMKHRRDNPTFVQTFLARLNWPGVTCRRVQLLGPSMRRPLTQEQTELPMGETGKEIA